MTLQDPLYLLSTVHTISNSLHDQSYSSIHHLLDAYLTFTNRVRSQSHLLDACDTPPPALAPLKIHKDTFISALRRDVRLAHIDPLSSLSHPGASSRNNVDTKQYARDSSALCHHALCVLTTMFRFPVLHSVLSERELSILFGDVLDIALAEQLPVLNKAKTYSLSLWALSSHCLPVSVLLARRDDVFSALRRCLEQGNIILDGLKAISHTIEHYPSEFLDLLFPLLPRVMTNLHCESSDLRLHASIVLGKFANVLIHQPELSLAKWQALSNHIMSYLESCCDESQVAPGETSFSRIIRAAFSSESHACSRIPPTWIFAVLASLIVLSGPALYAKPTALRFVFRALAMALTHNRSILRALHPHVWRCFIWTFSQMLLKSEDVDPALISSAFYVIKQEVGGGIGMALANALLSDRMTTIQSDKRCDRVSQALLVVKAMVRTECKHTRREGFMFLQAFTNVAPVRHQILQNAYEIPASVLFNGAIIGVKWDSLPSTIHSIPKVPVSVHRLEDTEIARHYKALLVIWKHFAIKVDGKDSDVGQLTAYLVRVLSTCTLFKPALVDVWLSILLACSHQLECGEHVTIATDVLRNTAAIIVEFLPSVALGDCQPDWGSWNVHDQLCSLTFINQLWFAMRKAFSALSLTEPAELILASILKYAFHILDLGVRTLWSRLCISLMTTASPSFLREIHDHTSSQLVIKSQRGLWGVIATSLSPSELGLNWKELVSFLAIPVCTWVLSKPELEAWEALLRKAITLSEDSAMVTEYFVLQHLQGKRIETWESVMTVLGFLLTCTCEHGNSPTHDLLSIVNRLLIISYSRAGHSSMALTHSLELLNVIRHVIISAPGKVIHMLQVLCNSLCLWIEDHTEVMSNDEFNSVAVSLYCETLGALEVLPLSIQSLRDMEVFLASAFSRIPTPAIAPFAFEKFWRATYHGHSQFRDILPPKIKSCLACFVTAYGGDLADGLSLATGSQSQSIGNNSSASLTTSTDDSQVHFSTRHRRRHSGELSLRASPSPTPINTGAWTEVSDTEVALYGQQRIPLGQEDTTFLMADDDVLQRTALRQLQEYSSRMDVSSPDGPEQSTSNPRILLSSIIPPSGAMPSSLSAGKNHSVTSSMPHQKRRLADGGDVPQKRGPTSRDTLRSARKLESEPVTREVTPTHVLRMKSVPPKKRKVFDGVHVPTFREISHQQIVPKAETGKAALTIEQGRMSAPQAPTSCSTHGKMRPPSTLILPVGSDGDNRENFCIDATSSEVDVDQSLVDIYPSSSPRTQSFALREHDDAPCLPSRLSLTKAMSQSEGSPPAPTRPSLRRAKTTSERLNALLDVYTSVASGASQISMSELVQATKLVHQISAVLTEQIGKKMSDPR